MYDDDRGTRLVMLTRLMAVDQNTPMSPDSRGSVTGFTWAAKGVGYSLVGRVSPEILHRIADDVRRQVEESA
jgi:anti-sigma factor RsiW